MAGILPDVFGAFGGGHGVLPFGGAPIASNPVDASRNAILGYLAGALQGGNLGQSIGRGRRVGLPARRPMRPSRGSARPRTTLPGSPTSIPPSDPC
jgi:hypothetical protein